MAKWKASTCSKRWNAGTSDQAWANPSTNGLDYDDNGTVAFATSKIYTAWSDNSDSTGATTPPARGRRSTCSRTR